MIMSTIQYFLKIDSIDGKSQDEQHKNEIELETWNWGESQSIVTQGGAGAGKVKIEELQVTMRISKASPKLMLAGSSGLHIRKAILTARKSGEPAVKFLRITLSDIIVASFQTSASLDDLPTDQVSLSFNKIEYEYTPQNLDGSLAQSIKASWDLKTNRSDR
jgi:type VI secretion system secreted protein Hcp